MAKFTHMPFASGQCDACHKPAVNGKVVLTAATPKEICLTCHSDKGEQIDKAKVQHPGAAGDCTDCHSPHAGNFPYFPKPNPVAVCLGCHSDMAELGKKAHPHQPRLSRAAASVTIRMATTIFTCCAPRLPMRCVWSVTVRTRPPAKLEGEHLVTIFDGKVKLPDDYFNKVVVLPIRYGLGHPVTGHPVSDVMDPKDVTKVNDSVELLELSSAAFFSAARPVDEG